MKEIQLNNFTFLDRMVFDWSEMPLYLRLKVSIGLIFKGKISIKAEVKNHGVVNKNTKSKSTNTEVKWKLN